MTVTASNDTVTYKSPRGDTERPADMVVAVNTDGTAIVASLRGAETTSTPAAVVLSASTAATLLAANTSRIRFTIINPLATPLYVRKAAVASAATAAAGGHDFVVGPGQQWQSDIREYAGALNGLCATAGSVGVSESV